MLFKLELEVKKLCISDFVRLVSSHVGSYLGWVISQVVAFASLILESLYSKWRVFISSHKLSSSLPLYSLFCAILPSIFILFYSLICSLLCSFSLIVPCLYFSMHHCHLIIVFSLCPSEVNLHTYLTTWLSSFPVGIFLGFLP